VTDEQQAVIDAATLCADYIAERHDQSWSVGFDAGMALLEALDSLEAA